MLATNYSILQWVGCTELYCYCEKQFDSVFSVTHKRQTISFHSCPKVQEGLPLFT